MATGGNEGNAAAVFGGVVRPPEEISWARPAQWQYLVEDLGNCSFENAPLIIKHAFSGFKYKNSCFLKRQHHQNNRQHLLLRI